MYLQVALSFLVFSSLTFAADEPRRKDEAQEVAEDENTRTDLPVEHRKAEEVEVSENSSSCDPRSEPSVEIFHDFNNDNDILFSSFMKIAQLRRKEEEK